jgi:hypothetical protein
VSDHGFLSAKWNKGKSLAQYLGNCDTLTPVKSGALPHKAPDTKDGNPRPRIPAFFVPTCEIHIFFTNHCVTLCILNVKFFSPEG